MSSPCDVCGRAIVVFAHTVHRSSGGGEPPASDERPTIIPKPIAFLIGQVRNDKTQRRFCSKYVIKTMFRPSIVCLNEFR